MKVKYPRTYHLPYSLGSTSDDKIQYDLSNFESKEIVITEKVDGENSNMTNKDFWNRSLDYEPHESRTYIKGIWGNIKYLIPDYMRICGENLYAKHSIEYNNLEDYFQVFSIWEDNKCLSFNDTLEWCDLLELTHVPILYQGLYSEKVIKETISRLDLTKQEGVVIRLDSSFKFEDFSKSVVKWVRPNHVQTDKHWKSQKLVKNKLKIN